MLQAEVFLAVGDGAVLVGLGVAWLRRPDDRARSVVWAAFALYVVLVLATTMLPIALRSFLNDQSRNYVNLVPFRGIVSDINISREQAIPNIILGIPFGFMFFFVVRRIRPWQVLVSGIGFFFAVELLQLPIAVLFPASPRTGDINDLMLNTMGVAFGILGFVLFADWFVRLDHKAELGSSQWVEYLRSVVGSESGVAASTDAGADQGSEE